jgi:dephospho-CoA kinase
VWKPANAGETFIKKLIGLTGTYCAGKNYIASILESRGIPVLDVDKLGHRAIETEQETIAGRFGTGILGADGSVDRRALGRLVFGRPQELAALQDIIHPTVNRRTGEWIEAQQGPCVINAALLHYSVVFTCLDCIILVEAPAWVRLLRARKRDKLPFLQLLRRFGSQKEFTSQYLNQKADIYRVENRGYFGFHAVRNRRLAENRVNEILSLVGMAE